MARIIILLAWAFFMGVMLRMFDANLMQALLMVYFIAATYRLLMEEEDYES